MNVVSKTVQISPAPGVAESFQPHWSPLFVGVLVAALHLVMVWWLIQLSPPAFKAMEFSTISGALIPYMPSQDEPQKLVQPKPKALPKVATKPPPPAEKVLASTEKVLTNQAPVAFEIPESKPEPEPITEPEPAPEKHEIEIVDQSLPEAVSDEVVSDTVSEVTKDEEAIAQTTAPVPIAAPRSDAAHLNNPLPAYPRQSKRRKEEGTVLLQVLILSDGTVGEARLKQSSGFSRLDQSALKAVKQWRYVPAMQGETAIDYWYEQPVVFALK